MQEHALLQVEEDNFKPLELLHHLTSGAKALGTEMMYNGVDELR